MNKEELENIISQFTEEEIMVMDGFEDAFIGLSKRCGQPTLATYSFNKMVQIMIERDDMDELEAIEYIEYNCLGAWVGDLTPLIIFEYEDPWIYEDEKQKPNECYMCEKSFLDILDLIDHIKTNHKNETSVQ